ncbi:hypothetical protein EV193_107213 [Herbihabitans rhizosphaerae]|uniref:Uncharacterized protein n=1 Tax=Herbihabitans rhizosphaerae TaxID=1872711 RepID=A0A4Q7KMU3_9PSEU|nr:hypothetical protein [Herbihabitans rhizosphaerae]RZS36532.1 hypothetical protein EV193_107213 [Herbihabitans rhizosphaerae]
MRDVRVPPQRTETDEPARRRPEDVPTQEMPVIPADADEQESVLVRGRE